MLETHPSGTLIRPREKGEQCLGSVAFLVTGKAQSIEPRSPAPWLRSGDRLTLSSRLDAEQKVTFSPSVILFFVDEITKSLLRYDVHCTVEIKCDKTCGEVCGGLAVCVGPARLPGSRQSEMLQRLTKTETRLFIREHETAAASPGPGPEDHSGPVGKTVTAFCQRISGVSSVTSRSVLSIREASPGPACRQDKGVP